MTTATAERGIATHCPYCALQCAMTVTASVDRGSVDRGSVQIAGRAFPTNRGGLCRPSALFG